MLAQTTQARSCATSRRASHLNEPADLSEPGYEAALLNDGRHGYHAIGNELGTRTPFIRIPSPMRDTTNSRMRRIRTPEAGMRPERWPEAEDLNRPLPSATVSAAAPVSPQPLSQLDKIEIYLDRIIIRDTS